MSVGKEVDTFVEFAEGLARGIVKVHGAARKVAGEINRCIEGEAPAVHLNQYESHKLVVCATCGGKGRLGAIGAEIPCPVCKGEST